MRRQLCIPKSTLYLSKLSGRLGIPNFSSYYYAAQLAQLPNYHAAQETPLWVAIKTVDCDPIKPHKPHHKTFPTYLGQI